MPQVKATEETILAAAEALAQGKLVGFPTETVYGLGADARTGEAVARIFEVKQRPDFNPLIVHVADLAAAQEIATFTPMAEKLAGHFWPGALTLVLPLKETSGISEFVSAGLGTIALRVPAHRVAAKLLEVSKLAIAAPSANLSGHVSPTTAEHVFADLGDQPAFILDGGPCPIGLESTVVGFEGDKVFLLRAGGISRDEIEEIVGAQVHEAVDGGETPISPGQLASHYSPNSPLRLNAVDVKPGEALIGFGADMLETDGPVINLSARGDLREAAANLFSALRELDAGKPAGIAVMTIAQTGLGEAINDRLKRAAAPR